MFFRYLDREGVNIETAMRIVCSLRLCASAASLKRGQKGGWHHKLMRPFLSIVSIGEKILEINLPVKGLNYT